jgi:hypothetical protein
MDPIPLRRRPIIPEPATSRQPPRPCAASAGCAAIGRGAWKASPSLISSEPRPEAREARMQNPVVAGHEGGSWASSCLSTQKNVAHFVRGARRMAASTWEGEL